MSESTSAEPTVAIVLAGCGHWWREHQPVWFRPTSPRVCTAHRPDHPAAVAPSPQGFAMVEVVYLPDTDTPDRRS